ncbi:MAG: hypothetical protein ACRDP9_26060 [Kribbellaceae bacterium]
MNTQLNDDELAEAVRRLEVTDPLPAVDPDALLTRGRRGVRRRRIFTGTGAAAVVAAIAVSAALLPDLGSAGRAPGVANSPSASPTRVTASGFMAPIPGVSAGDAALATISKQEAQRRCELREPGMGDQVMSVGPYRGGGMLLVDPRYRKAAQPSMCNIPGDSRPTTAGLAVLKSDPLPRDTAGLLRNCSLELWHDLRSWTVTAKDTAPGLVTTLVAVSPSGRYVAHCQLTANGGDGGSGPGLYAVGPATNQLAYLGGAGTACPIFGVRCVGWVAYESGRVPSNVAKLRFISKNGRSHDVAVRDGWYALAWNDTAPNAQPNGPLTVYDSRGKVIFRR